MADNTDDGHLDKHSDAKPENNSPDRVPETENTNADQKEQPMEVHHHTHPSHDKRNWRSYFWEFLMLFLAVTLGSFVENQREHYIEGMRAKEFSKSLIQDLQNDTAAISRHKKIAFTYIALADSILILSESKLEGRASAQFSFYTRFMYWTGAIIWNRSTFEQIKNSGSLRYFKNQELLQKMMKYDGAINNVEVEAYNRQVRGNLLVNSINKIIDPLYHQKLSRYYLMNYDAISSETIESLYPANPESLEGKRDEIRELLNMVVVQQRNMRRDMEVSWKQAEDMAIELIGDLKEEYHLE